MGNEICSVSNHDAARLDDPDAAVPPHARCRGVATVTVQCIALTTSDSKIFKGIRGMFVLVIYHNVSRMLGKLRSVAEEN